MKENKNVILQKENWLVMLSTVFDLGALLAWLTCPCHYIIGLCAEYAGYQTRRAVNMFNTHCTLYGLHDDLYDTVYDPTCIWYNDIAHHTTDLGVFNMVSCI